MTAMGLFVRWWLGLASPTTQTTDAERDCIARYAAGCKNVAEIGVWHGVTTCQLLQAMDPAGTLWAVDPYPKGRLGFSTQRVIAHRTVRPFDRGRVRWLRTTGREAAPLVSGQVDFLFIDGDHTYE